MQISIYIIYKHKLNVPKCPVTNPLTSGRAIFPHWQPRIIRLARRPRII